MFLDGLWFGIGVSAGVLLAGGGLYAWGRLQRRDGYAPREVDEDDFTEDPRPDWMKARSRGPYDPTAGYVAKRGNRRRTAS